MSRTTARSETRRVREILIGAGIINTIVWGLVAAGVVLDAGGAIGHAAKLSDTFFAAVRMLAAVAGVMAIGFRLWRIRHAWVLERVALWVEEHTPELQYALVTAIDPGPVATRGPLERTVREIDLPRVALWAAVVAYGRSALIMIVVAVILQRVMPLHAVRAGAPAVAERPLVGPPITGSRLAALRVHVVPPAYAGQSATDLSDPSTIAALVGSAITIRGRGSPDGLGAATSATLVVRPAGNGWETGLPMPAQATALVLTDGERRRVIVLAPRLDDPPAVVLTEPRTDATYRTPPAAIELDAEAIDDIALANGYFEYIVSKGQAEGSFTGITGTTGRVSFGARRSSSFHATLPLGPLGLTPGSQLSVRAVARDGNTVSGPGVGTSETRTLRIARPEEYDSLALDAAPPPVTEKAFMSQRMLVMAVESLVTRRPRPPRARYVAQSSRLAGEESRLAQEVDDILNAAPAGADSGGEPGEREDVDASKGGAGSVGANRERALMQRALQAMTDAARSLGVALPDTALPSARLALAILDSARVMNRLYVRGGSPKIVVDIGRVRGKGAAGGPTDSAAPAPRGSLARDSVRALTVARLSALVDLVTQSPQALADTLSLLQVTAMPVDPALATALGDAAGALRAGRDVRPALERVRAAAAPPPRARQGLGPAAIIPVIAGPP